MSEEPKRSLPEPLTHAILVKDFTEFTDDLHFLAMVRIQLKQMKEQAVKAEKDNDVKRCDDALLFLSFLELGVQNKHTIEGLEEAKKKFYEAGAGSLRDAISKRAVAENLGDLS